MVHWGFASLSSPICSAGLLSSQDAERYRVAGPRRRQEILQSRSLVRRLASAIGITHWSGIESDADGRPVLAGAAGFSVSLSHAGAWVLGAISDQAPVGVDIEPVGAVFDQPGLWRRMCSPDEYRALRRFEPRRRRHRAAELWTAKEAALKATGRGLRDDPRQALARPFHLIRLPWTPEDYAAAIVVLPGTAAGKGPRGP